MGGLTDKLFDVDAKVAARVEVEKANLEETMNRRIQETETKMMEISERKAMEKANEIVETYKQQWDLEKARTEKEKYDAEAKSYMYDPFTLIESLGYKERIMSMSYDTLRLMSERNAVVAAIINTRIHQVTAFARPPKTKYDIGYEFVMRDRDNEPSDEDKARMKELGKFLEATGLPSLVEEESRDSFENFLSKIVRDSLTYDQACHPEGVLLDGKNGIFRPIEDIQVGEFVRTSSGVLKKVLETKKRLYSGDLITLKSGNQEVKATEGHPFLVVKNKWLPSYLRKKVRKAGLPVRPEWVEARDLKQGYYLVYPKPVFDKEILPSFEIENSGKSRLSVSYEEIAKKVGIHPGTVSAILGGTYRKTSSLVSEVKEIALSLGFTKKLINTLSKIQLSYDFCKLCGLYLAEGDVTFSNGKAGKVPNGVKWSFHSKEKELARFVEDTLIALGVSTSTYWAKDRKAVSVYGNCSGLAKFFLENFKTGSKNKEVSEWVFYLPLDFKRGIVEGYLLGDGSFSKGQCSFSTTSIKLFGGIKLLLASLGIYVRMGFTPTHTSQGCNFSDLYSGTASGKEIRRIFKIEAKSYKWCPRYTQDNKYFYLKISHISKEKVVDLPVFNLEVEDDHSYIANGFVSHNCYEIVSGRGRKPVAFYAVDGSTIRYATTPSVLKRMAGYSESQVNEMWRRQMAEMNQNVFNRDQAAQPEKVKYVQVISGRVMNTYTEQEMAFAIRNPRTYLQQNNYGVAELEIMVSVVTSHLWAEEYNKRFFSTGSAPKGIIHFDISGSQVPQDQLNAFRRQWHAQVAGVWNAWKTPILATPGKMNYQSLQMGNKQMEFTQWINYLVKLLCAIYMIDPAEINFENERVGSTGTPQFYSVSEAKLKMSRDRGLQPLLRFLEADINKNLIWIIDPRYELQFVGMDARTEKDMQELRMKELQNWRTVDEVRAEDDLDPLGPEKGGDLIMNPSYITYRTQLAMQQQMSAGGIGGPGGPAGGGPGGPGGAPEMGVEAPDFGSEGGEFDQGLGRLSGERKEAVGPTKDIDKLLSDLKAHRAGGGLKKSITPKKRKGHRNYQGRWVN